MYVITKKINLKILEKELIAIQHLLTHYLLVVYMYMRVKF